MAIMATISTICSSLNDCLSRSKCSLVASLGTSAPAWASASAARSPSLNRSLVSYSKAW
jgi:hypothetical protein